MENKLQPRNGNENKLGSHNRDVLGNQLSASHTGHTSLGDPSPVF